MLYVKLECSIESIIFMPALCGYMHKAALLAVHPVQGCGLHNPVDPASEGIATFLPSTLQTQTCSHTANSHGQRHQSLGHLFIAILA
jgi:hypothetical protein